MKKRSKFIAFAAAFVLILDLMLPMAQAGAAGSNQKIDILLDGNKLSADVAPTIKDGRVMVPFRVIFEALGATFSWDNQKKVIESAKSNVSFQLTVNSKTAYINGANFNMDVAPVIIEGRTLVPLRFVSESYGAYVAWDNQAKRVSISTDGSITPPSEPNPPASEYNLYFNDEKVTTSTPPILKNSRIQIAMETLLQEMEGDVYWKNMGDRLGIMVDDVELIIYADKNYALINGEYLMTTESPVVHNGKFYVPMSYIKEALGGIATYDSSTKTVYVKINKVKFESEFLEKEAFEMVKPTNIPSASFVGQRRLMISDNPETLNHNTVPSNEETLWQDEVDTDEPSVNHRVYGWHVNNLGRKVNVGITIENMSSTNDIEITDSEGIDLTTSNGWYHHDVGLPMAEAVLLDKLEDKNLEEPVVKANETAVINAFSIEENFLIGFLHDLTVKKASGEGNMNYKIRVVVSQTDSDLTEIKSEPVEMDTKNLHPRGVWESAQLEAVLPEYKAGSEEVAYSFSNGKTDNLMSVQSSIYGNLNDLVWNPGHFGATYKVKIPITNFGGEKTVRIRIGARGGRYSGAVKVNDEVFLVPSLNPAIEAAKVIDYKVTGTQDEIELEFMHSGGAALPIAIDLMTLK